SAAEVELRLDDGTQRAERVEALRARPLTVRALQVAGGDVIGHGVAEYVFESAIDGDILRDAPDDDRELALEIGALRLARTHDDVARADHRRVRLQEQKRLSGSLPAHLGGVVVIVLAHA